MLTLACLILAIAGAQVVSLSRELSVIFLLDRSLSTGSDSLQWQRDFIERALPQATEGQAFGILLFAEQTREELSVAAHEITALAPFSAVVEKGASQLTSALRFAATAFPGGTANRLVILSDGQSTEAEAVEQAAALSAAGIEVWTVPTPEQGQTPELLLSGLEAPNSIAKNEPFLLRAVVESQGVSQAELLLSANGQLVERLKLTLRDGPNLFLIPQRRTQSGAIHYEARILSEADTRPENNKAETLVLVGREQVVLVLRSQPGPSALVPWLEQAGLKARVVTPPELPRRVAAWRDVSALIIEDVSALDWSVELQTVVSLLVRDAGMGLMMLGSDATFGVGGYSYTPIEELLPVELAIRRPKDMPLAALVSCLDKSGSMTGRPIEMAREAAIAAGQTLSEKDLIGVVAFDEAARWVYSLAPKEDGSDFINKVASLRAGGGTDMYPALQEAISELEAATAALKHVIVLSDGATRPAAFEALMERAVRARITVSAVALGSGADVDFLQRLTQQGKGRLYLAPEAGAGSPLPQIFVREAILATGSGLSTKPVEVRPTSAGVGSPILQGLEFARPPRLSTYNLTSPKDGTASTLLASPQGDPILATGRAGLGKTAAWTSDLGGHWAASWAAAAGVGQSSLLETLILRSIRSINAAGDLSERSGGVTLQARASGSGDLSSVVLEVHSREPLRGPVEAVLVNGRGERTAATLHPSSPYFAKGSATVNQAGSLLVFAHDSEKNLLAKGTAFVPLAPEFARLGNDRELLKALSSRPGGRFEATAEEVFRPPSQPFPKPMPLAHDLIRGAILLLLVEIAVRRLPRPRLKARVAPSSSPVAEELSRTMASLRQVKASTRQSEPPQNPPNKPRIERPSADGTEPSKKPTVTRDSEPSAPTRVEPESPKEATLERLRRVKRRSRERS